MQLFHQDVVEQDRAQNIAVNPCSGAYWKAVKDKWAALPPEEKAKYERELERLQAYRQSSRAVERTQHLLALEDGGGDDDDGHAIVPVPAMPEREPPHPVAVPRSVNLMRYAENSCAEDQASGPLVIGAAANHEEAAAAAPLLPSVLKQFLADTPRQWRECHGRKRGGGNFEARTRQFANDVSGVAFERHQIPRSVPYEKLDVCGLFCRRHRRQTSAHNRKWRLSEALRLALNKLVSELGGMKKVIPASHLFAIEVFEGVEQVGVYVINLCVAMGNPIDTVYLFCDPLAPLQLPVRAEDYAGLEVGHARTAYIPYLSAKGDATHEYTQDDIEGTVGPLDHATSEQLRARVIGDATTLVQLRRLRWDIGRTWDTLVVDGVEGAVEVVEPVRATVKRKCKQHGLDWSLALATAAPEGSDAPEEVLEEEPVEDPSAVEYMAPVAGLAGEQPENRDVFCALSALWRDVGASAREELAPILLDAEKQEEADQAIAEDEDLLDAEAQAASPSDVAEAGPSAPAGAGPSAPAEAEPPADVSPLAPSIAVIQDKYGVSLRHVRYNSSYNVLPPDNSHIVGTVFTLGSGSLQAVCKRGHGKCRLFFSPAGDWLKGFEDCVKWLALDLDKDNHAAEAECIKKAYKRRPSNIS